MKLLNTDVKVRYLDEVPLPDGSDKVCALGYADGINNEILLRKNNNEDLQKKVLLHEIIHIVIDSFRLEMSETHICLFAEALVSCDAIIIKLPNELKGDK